MNNVLTKTEAANGKRLARFVRHGVVACMLACTTVGAMAAGQDRSPRREEMQQQNMRDRYDARVQDPRYDQRANELREEARMRQEQSRREESMREDSRRGSGRMTADERSDLRRQINEANRDLYPNARRR